MRNLIMQEAEIRDPLVHLPNLDDNHLLPRWNFLPLGSDQLHHLVDLSDVL